MKRILFRFSRVLFLISIMSVFQFSGLAQAAESENNRMNWSRFMESATTMMDGYSMMKIDMMKKGIMRDDDVLPGAKVMIEGYEKMIGGEKMLRDDSSTDGKGMMVDGSEMMIDGHSKMMDDLVKKGIVNHDEMLPGGKMMMDGKKMMMDSHGQMMTRK